MGCRFSDFHTGKCELWDENIDMPGCNHEGVCIVDEDEDPDCEDFDEN